MLREGLEHVLSDHVISEQRLENFRSAKVRKFYRAQNEMIENLVGPDARSDGTHRAIYVLGASLLANIVLLIVKAIIAVLSSSLVVLASAVDSLLDVVSSIFFVYTTTRKSHKSHEFPLGKNRIESPSIIIFATAMGMASFQVIVESIRSLVTGDHDVELNTVQIVLFALIILTKLVLFIICRVQLNSIPSLEVETLAQDHLNDVISNSLSLLVAVLASHYRSLSVLDPIGALVISLVIVYVWVSKGKEHLDNLIGKSAPKETISKMIYLTITSDARIQCIDSVLAYHVGSGLIVEAHIVLDGSMPLREAHDIGEQLEQDIEKLEYVDRAFIHLDWIARHKMEHK